MPENSLPKRRRGRPSRVEAAAWALATVNPRAILAQIAADTTAPATARVAACKALLGLDVAPTMTRDSGDLRERVANKAVELLASGRLH